MAATFRPSTGPASVLGYLIVDGSDFKKDTQSIPSTAAVDMALHVYNGYIRDSLSVSAPTPSTGFSAYSAQCTSRIADASYYYAMEAMANNYLALKIKNIGATPNSKIGQILIAKAKALQTIARQGIERFEQWCATDAAIYGANYVVILDSISSIKQAAADGLKDAKQFYTMNSADFDSTGSAVYTADTDFKNIMDYGGYGYSLRNAAFLMLGRKAGFSDARNPAIGQYYQQIGNALSEIASQIIGVYENFITTQKIQRAMTLIDI